MIVSYHQQQRVKSNQRSCMQKTLMLRMRIVVNLIYYLESQWNFMPSIHSNWKLMRIITDTIQWATKLIRSQRFYEKILSSMTVQPNGSLHRKLMLKLCGFQTNRYLVAEFLNGQRKVIGPFKLSNL